MSSSSSSSSSTTTKTSLKKNIVVSLDTYNKLASLGKKGETFDQIISKLLTTDRRD